jgi:hypothetical protein
MPSVNETFRSRMTAWQPGEIVLLCEDYPCKGAEPSPRRAGYKPELQSLTILRSEGVRVWVKI